MFSELLVVITTIIPMIQDDQDDMMLLLLVFMTNVVMETFMDGLQCGICHHLRVGPMTGNGSMDKHLQSGSTLGLVSLEMMWIRQILWSCREELSGPSTQPDVPVRMDSSSRSTPLRTAFISFEDPSLERVTEFVYLVEHVLVETGGDFNYKSNLLN